MDPRIVRTRRSLQQALFALARERSLDDITVGDIAERAGVNRSSYYQHYSDKEMLLADALDAAAEAAVMEITMTEAVDPDITPETHPWLLGYLEHIFQNASLYRRVLGDHGSAVAMSRTRHRLELVVHEALAKSRFEPPPDVPLDVAAAGIIGSAIGVVTAWLNQPDFVPVETAARWVGQMLRLQGVLDGDQVCEQSQRLSVRCRRRPARRTGHRVQARYRPPVSVRGEPAILNKHSTRGGAVR